MTIEMSHIRTGWQKIQCIDFNRAVVNDHAPSRVNNHSSVEFACKQAWLVSI